MKKLLMAFMLMGLLSSAAMADEVGVGPGSNDNPLVAEDSGSWWTDLMEWFGIDG